MKALFSMLCLMLFVTGFAQDSIPVSENDQDQNTTQLSSEATGDTAKYTLGSEEFKFIPEPLGYRIAKLDDGKEIEYGHLRLTTDDGYYVMTSTLSDHVSYGRFDDSGNFNAMRYDEETDQVVEERFVIAYSD